MVYKLEIRCSLGRAENKYIETDLSIVRSKPAGYIFNAAPYPRYEGDVGYIWVRQYIYYQTKPTHDEIVLRTQQFKDTVEKDLLRNIGFLYAEPRYYDWSK